MTLTSAKKDILEEEKPEEKGKDAHREGAADFGGGGW